MKEEFLLEQRYGKRRPFKVPDGYFRQFEISFMRNLKEHDIVAMKRRIPVWKYVACAACTILIAISGFILFYENMNKEDVCNADNMKSYSSSSVNDYMIDDIYDYAMLDNDDIYSYVSDE